MRTQLQLEGPDLETLLARVRTELGGTAKIVKAEKVRSGGVAGFFAKQSFEITVEVDESALADEAPAPAAAPLSLLELADQVSDSERAGAGLAALPTTTSAATTAAAPAVADAAPAETGSFASVLAGLGLATPATLRAARASAKAAAAGAPAPPPATTALLDRPADEVIDLDRPRPSTAARAAGGERTSAPADGAPTAPAPAGRTAAPAERAAAPAGRTAGSVPPPATTTARTTGSVRPEVAQVRTPEQLARPGAPVVRPVTFPAVSRTGPDAVVPRPRPAADDRPDAGDADDPFVDDAPAARRAPAPSAPTAAPAAPAAAAPARRPSPSPRAARPAARGTTRPAPTAARPAGPVVARPAARRTAPFASPSAVPAQLARLGLPEHLRPEAGDRPLQRALTESLRALPAVPRLRNRAGSVIAVVGPAALALQVARAVAADLKLPVATNVVLATTRKAMTDLPERQVVRDVDEAAERRTAWKRRRTVTVVAVDAPLTAAGAAQARGYLTALGAASTWGVVEATRKAGDVGAWATALGGVDALAVTGAEESGDPATVLQLGIPVSRLGDRRATASAWASLLVARVAV